MIKLVPLCVSLLLTACAGSTPAPASSPPAAASAAGPQPAGAAESQSEGNGHDDLKVELAAIEAALADMSKRLEVAGNDVKAYAKPRLTALQKREDDLRAQLKATGALADTEAENARREIHRAVMDLEIDMMQLTEHVPH